MKIKINSIEPTEPTIIKMLLASNEDCTVAFGILENTENWRGIIEVANSNSFRYRFHKLMDGRLCRIDCQTNERIYGLPFSN